MLAGLIVAVALPAHAAEPGAATSTDRSTPLFYRAGDGVAVTGRLDSAGTLVDQRSVGPFATGWTHIVAAGGGRLLFYRAGDGVAVTGRVDSGGALVDQRSVGPLAPGWTHVMAEGGGRLLFYRAGDGVVVTGRVDGGGALVDQRSLGLFAPGWTHIVPDGIGRLMFYRAGDGVTVTGRVDSDGTVVDQRAVGPLMPGWTHIVTSGVGRLLFYRAGDGTTVTGRVQTGVDGGTLIDQRNIGPFAPGWTHIVPAGAGRLMFYRAGDGVTVTGRVDNGSGLLVDQRTVGPLSPGWTHLADPFASTQDFFITTHTQRDLFLQGIGTPDATVRIAGDVFLDLSGLEGIRIAPGVHIIGDRTRVPLGPKLYTTSFPHMLFVIGGASDFSDNIRISGIRLDGGLAPGHPFDAVGDASTDTNGITVYSSQNIEIDHNVISGWKGAGVEVLDYQGRLNFENRKTVWIHDNAIHNNNHPTKDGICCGGHGAGYGVSVKHGGYALIERNTFSDNRHDVTSGWEPGNGYIFYRNFVLSSGGTNSNTPFNTTTHVIDVHGRDCTAHQCGPAGEFFEIAYNTILYTQDYAIKLRGTPSNQMYVSHNVFRTSNPGDAIHANESGMTVGPNIFGFDSAAAVRTTCSFDGDNVDDTFMATGNAWWYRSSAVGQRWVYLNDSTAKVNQVTLGDTNGDGRCDVQAGGKIFLTASLMDETPSPSQ